MRRAEEGGADFSLFHEENRRKDQSY